MNWITDIYKEYNSIDDEVHFFRLKYIHEQNGSYVRADVQYIHQPERIVKCLWYQLEPLTPLDIAQIKMNGVSDTAHQKKDK